MPDSHFTAGDAAQMRVIAEAFAESIVSKYPSATKAEKLEIPPIFKVAGGIITALMTAGVIALVFWLVSTVNTMQQTLVRMDERQQAQTGSLDSRFGEQERRISQLEGYHRKDAL